jgi:murein DD-endopeptidase MepM/ murein hydrolase activator NlpD
LSFADRPRPPRGPVVVASIALAAVLGAAALGASGALRLVPAPVSEPTWAAAPPAVPSAPAQAVAEASPLRLASRVVRIQRDGTLGRALAELGLDGAQAGAVLAALKGQVDFARLRPGDQVRVERLEGEKAIRRLSYRQGPADEWIVEPGPGGALAARKRQVDISTHLARVAVDIDSSLWDSIQAAGEDPAVAVLASEALAWDVDFYQDVRRGDRLSLLVEKVYADGRFLRFGEVRAVEFAGEQVARRLYLWKDPEGRESYYDDEGNSARRGFLKSPLRYAHVTSRFGGRRHPLLGYTRAHQGVDYAAPAGTPVWAVGDATVTFAGTQGACGKSVILRHRNGYTTQYCHLSSIAVARGERVSQKKVIGATGDTGLATGPHLHYAVKKGGTFVNPLQLRLPREAPVPERWKPEFARAIAPLQAQLQRSGVVMQ